MAQLLETRRFIFDWPADIPARCRITNAPGESVGYGATWRAQRPTRIATIAAGYADGIARSSSSQDGKACVHVLIDAHKAPIVGRVSMDLITVDVTDLPSLAVEPGSQAVLIGPGLTIEDAGYAAGTIGYEVLTRLGRRFSRRYLGAYETSGT